MQNGDVIFSSSKLIDVLAEALLDAAAYSDETGELIREGCDSDPVTWANATDQGRDLGKRLAETALMTLATWIKDPKPLAWIYQGNVIIPLVELPPGFVPIRYDHLEADIPAVVAQPDVLTVSVSWSRMANGSDYTWVTTTIHALDHSIVAQSSVSNKTGRQDTKTWDEQTRQAWEEAKEQLEAHRAQVAIDGV